MQRTYSEWRRTALSLDGALTAGQREELKIALRANRPVLVNGTLLMIDTSTAFASGANPDGKFVHGQNHQGFVCAASETTCDADLDEALRWAEEQINAPDGQAPWSTN